MTQPNRQTFIRGEYLNINCLHIVLVIHILVQVYSAGVAGNQTEDWQLAFKAKSGVPHPDPYELWWSDSYGSLNADVFDAAKITSTFQGHYKSYLISQWESLNITKVKLALYSLDGEELISFTFRGSNNRWNWFSANNLLDVNPYRNTAGVANHFFSLAGQESTTRATDPNRFVIKPSSSDSCDQIGWITMVTEDGGCRWESLRPSPSFIYSRKHLAATWPAWIQDSDTECYTESNGQDYRGNVSNTETGKTCQTWTSQNPHAHRFSPVSWSDDGLDDHNYCRNPDGEQHAWCYTTDPDTRWEYCNIGLPRRGCDRFFDCRLLGPDWIFWNQSCYLYLNKPVSWDDASHSCTQENQLAHILVVNSKEENAIVQSFLPQSNTPKVWLGCRDWNTNGMWTCLDSDSNNKHTFDVSSPTSTGFWYWDVSNAQPNGGVNENCLVRGSSLYETPRWHDWPCDGSATFPTICEVPISSLMDPTYIGCFFDTKDERLLSSARVLISNSMNLTRCFNYCSSLNMAYAGLEYGRECYCGSSELDLFNATKPDSECDIKCKGNNTQICGGGWRLSIYDLSRDNEIGIADVLAVFVQLDDSPKNCPENISAMNEEGKNGIAVFWTEPSADSTVTTVSRSHQPGSLFPVGTSQVTYTYVDEITGNMFTCSFVVTVIGEYDEDTMTGLQASGAIAVAVGLGILFLIVLAVVLAIIGCLYTRRTKQTKSDPNEEFANNRHDSSMPNRLTLKTPVDLVSPATCATIEEETYEQLEDRPLPKPYTDLSLYCQPMDDHSKHSNRYELQTVSQYSDIII